MWCRQQKAHTTGCIWCHSVLYGISFHLSPVHWQWCAIKKIKGFLPKWLSSMWDMHVCIPEAEKRKGPCVFLLRLDYVVTVSQAWDQFSPRSKALVTPSSFLSFYIPWSLDRFPLAMTFQCLIHTQSRVGSFSAAQQIFHCCTLTVERYESISLVRRKAVVRFKRSLRLPSLTRAAISLPVFVTHRVCACCSDVELLRYPEFW